MISKSILLVALLSITAVVCAPNAALAQAKAKPKAASKEIDPDQIIKKFKRGQFMAEATISEKDAKPQTESEAMCMDDGQATGIVMSVLMGVTGCEQESIVTSETDSSLTVKALCKTGKLGPNYYAGQLKWSADGKSVVVDTKRFELSGDKPSTKVQSAMSIKHSFQSPKCQ